MLFNEKKSKIDDSPYYVNVHVKSGESLAIQLFDGNKRFITGPATITMPSHQAYPPIPIPINLPPGHSMQQIFDENGILKHIIIGSPSSASDSMCKNQILTKNGAKINSLDTNALRSSNYKKKITQSNSYNNESTYTKQTNRSNGLTNNASINSSNVLINSSSLVYPFCCCCCPECVPNNQMNSSSMNLFSNSNELNYGRPNFYSSNTTSGTTGKQSTMNNYIRRSFTNNNISSTKGNRSDKFENIRTENVIFGRESINTANDIKNGIHLKSGQSIHKRTILNSSNLTNYSPPKNALLSSKQICKQCQPVCTNNYSNNSFYSSNCNQKYFYPNSYHQPSAYQSNTYQTSTHQTLQQQKYSYASDAIKQSLNKNQRASKSNHLISQPPPSQPLLTNTKQTGKPSGGYILSSKNESDYCELIRYVISNHMSAFKAHKRIDLDTKKSQRQLNGHDIKGRTSNSVTASSSPISEHYDFSSEESEQTNYKQTSLLGYPTNYSTNYRYSNSYSSGSNYSTNFSNGSSTNSSTSNSSANNNLSYQVANRKFSENDIQINEKKEISKIIITNDDNDDGYEDDYELKNCDSKSNDGTMVESGVIEKITDEQSMNQEIQVIDYSKENELTMNEINSEQNKIFDNLTYKQSNETVSDVDQQTELAKNEEIDRILDENSNEIGVLDRNMLSKKLETSNIESCEDDHSQQDSIDQSKTKIDSVEASEQTFEIESTEQQPNKKNDIITDNKPIKKKQELSFTLSYTKLTGSYVKLKWTVLNNGNNIYTLVKENQFMVEMIYSKRKGENGVELIKASRIVYTGPMKHCKIQCLEPFEEYSFRVKLLHNDHQLISNLLTITTPEQIQPVNAKKHTSKQNIQFSLQQQQLLKQQQIMIEQKEKELLLKQSQLNQQQTSIRSVSLISLLCAIIKLFKDNFAYLLIIFFSISAFFFANFISKDLLN